MNPIQIAMPSTIDSTKQKKITEQKELEIPIDNLHQKAFNNSLLANIIFIVNDGRIIRVNRAACKLLRYSKKELLTKNRKDIFRVSEDSFKKMMKQRKEEGSAKADLSMIKKSGKFFPCEITSVIFKDDNGISNSILSIVDLTERIIKQDKIDIEKEKKVASDIVIAQSKSDTRHEGNKEWKRSVSRTSYDVIWDWDVIADEISFGNTYEKVFGYKLPAKKISFKEWTNFFRPEEREILRNKINTVLETENKSWEDNFQFACPDGSISQVISRANIIRDDSGKIIRIIGVIHDTSKEQKTEERIELNTLQKERQIIEAIVEAKEMERSDIGRELHDNINQLLGISILYLGMARNDIKNGDVYLSHSSEYILNAIEEIRKLTKGLTTDAISDFGLCGAIENISKVTMETYPVKVFCMLDDTMEDKMTHKFKLNTFRILQEQMNNILKHAKATEIHITVSQTDAGFLLSIADNGKGFDTKKKMNGIGISNIISRAELYHGNANFISEIGKGCMLALTFPVDNAAMLGVPAG